jgi:hypothetical protein
MNHPAGKMFLRILGVSCSYWSGWEPVINAGGDILCLSGPMMPRDGIKKLYLLILSNSKILIYSQRASRKNKLHPLNGLAKFPIGIMIRKKSPRIISAVIQWNIPLALQGRSGVLARCV